MLDTNVWISAILFPGSTAAHALRRVLVTAHVVISQAAYNELSAVLDRSKFNSIRTLADRRILLANLATNFAMTEISHTVRECRDAKDDKFLELALSGTADLIITGDRDLTVLHPWSGIAILTPRQYLEL